MNRDRFYELVDAAREGVDDEAPTADADDLRVQLETLDDEDLLGFARRFRDELVRLNTWSVRAAGSLAAGDTGDDGFHAFRCWLIGKGSAAVETALTDPDDLAALLDQDRPRNDALEVAALDLLDERGLLDPRLDDDAPAEDGEPIGDPIAAVDLEARFPRIAARVASLP